MLAREYLLLTKSLSIVKKEGKLIQGNNFGVIVRNREDDKPPRFGFVVSTKISKLAVHRNRIRRAMIESARHNFFSVASGYDFLFLAKTTMGKMTTEEIMKEVADFLHRYNKK